MSEPAWGSAPPNRPPEKAAPLPPVHFQPRMPAELEEVRRKATTALIINAVLAIFLFGLLCIPGAVLAAIAMGERDPEKARRLLKWSWGFLAANLVFYVLLVVMIVLFVIYLVVVVQQ